MEENLVRALEMLRFYECEPESLLRREQLASILNRQAALRRATPFSPQIIDEIWGQAETTSRAEATALTFAKIYAQAIAILQSRVELIDGPRGIAEKEASLTSEQVRLAELEVEYEKGYIENYDRINSARKNIVALQNKIRELQQLKENFKKELQEMTDCLQVERQHQRNPDRTELVESRLEGEAEAPSEDLSLIFKCSVAGACLQLPFANFHPAFLPLLCYALILYWLFLGYYDQYFIKNLILILIVSCLMDLTYVCLVFAQNIGSHRLYDQQTIFRYISVAFTALEVAIRVGLVVKLAIFREPSSKKQYFMVLGRRIELNARSGKVSRVRGVRD